MTNFIKEHKVFLLAILIISLAVPLIISLMMFVPWFSRAKGDESGWLSFWGSYLGGIFSGLMTFLGVYFAFRLERETKKKDNVRFNYKITFDLFDLTNKLIKYIKRDEHIPQQLESLKNMNEKLITEIKNVDLDWYIKAKHINSNIWIEILDGKGNLKKIEKEILKLHMDVKKYIEL